MSIPRPSSKNEEQNRHKRRRNAPATRNFSIIDGSQGSDLFVSNKKIRHKNKCRC